MRNIILAIAAISFVAGVATARADSGTPNPDASGSSNPVSSDMGASASPTAPSGGAMAPHAKSQDRAGLAAHDNGSKYNDNH